VSRSEFDAVYAGTLKRHQQTLAGIVQGRAALPAPRHKAGPDSTSTTAKPCCAPSILPLPRPDTPELYRHHFRLLCDALAQWMGGPSARGMPDWNGLRTACTRCSREIRHQHSGQNVLLVSSGDPISAAVGQVLGTAPEVTIALNMRLQCAVTEFSISPKRLMLQSFNTLNHLDGAEYRNWITGA
jgi:broad specificity phosphatase PhoE